MKVYLANSLFNVASLAYNAMVAEEIREEIPDVELYVPQEAPFNDKANTYADSKTILHGDLEKLDEADVLIAILDHDDSGVALEIGYFYTKEKPIMGIYTDTRRTAFGNKEAKEATDVLGENPVAYTNLMVVGAIKERGELVDSHDEAIRLLKNLKFKEDL